MARVSDADAREAVVRVAPVAASLTNVSDRPQNGTPDARERLLTAAYELFSTRGVQAVGIDVIIQRSGVARQTMYRHFDSKQDLVLAFLQRREELWTRDWLQGTVERAADDPAERLLAIFDAFDRWFREPGVRGLLVHQRDARAPWPPTTPCTAPAPPTWRRSGVIWQISRAATASPIPNPSRGTGIC